MPEKLYDVLDVDDDASQSEIQRAYRTKVKECHPDVSDHPDAARRFQLILKAREILTDPDQRERYDDLGHDAYMDWFGNDDGNGSSGSASASRSKSAEPDESDRSTGPTASSDSAGREDRATDDGTGDSAVDDSGTGTSRTGATSASTSSDSKGASTTGHATSDGRSSSDPDDGASTSSSSKSGASSGTTSKASGSAAAADTSASTGASGSTSSGSAASTGSDTKATERGTSADAESDAGSSSSTASGASTSSGSSTARTSRSSAVQGTTAAVDESAVSDAAERKRKRWQAQSRRSGSGGSQGPWSSSTPHGDGLRAERVTPGIATKIRSKDVVVMALTMLVAYPIFVFSTVWPDFPLAVKVFVAVVTVGVVVYVLTEPAVSLVVFGTWSVLTPLLLVFIDVELVSLPGLFALSVTWVPFLLAVLLTLAMPD